MPTITRASPTDRSQIGLTSRGILSEPFPLVVAGSFAAATSGRLYGLLAGFRAGDVISSISVCLGGVGTGVTLFKVAVYDIAGNRLAVSADQTSALVASVVNALPLTASYTVPTDGGYYIAALGVTATTMPTFGFTATAGQFGTPVGTGARFSTIMNAQSDLPVSATWAAGSQIPWLAAS